MTQLTEQQAYLAMFAFLEAQYRSTGSDDLGALLGSLSLLPDGSPADPAFNSEWSASVEAALAGRVSAGLSLR
jgi:hypothetical protein